MREIKFRAWNGGMMRYLHDGDINLTQRGVIAPNEMNEWWKAREWPLMQYTGLKDKNGKEIYEGDFVIYLNLNIFTSDHVLNRELCMEYARTGFVKYMQDTCQFMLAQRDQSDSYNFSNDLKLIYGDDEEMQVIGNIYENPELIKKEE